MESLSLWGKLDRKTRLVFLEKSDPVHIIRPQVFESHYQTLLNMGLLIVSSRKGWVKLDRKAADFYRGLVASNLVKIHSTRKNKSERQTLQTYLAKHFTNMEIMAFLAGQSSRYENVLDRAASVLSSANWLRQFIAAKTPKSWENKYAHPDKNRFFKTRGVVPALKVIVEYLMAAPEPVPFRDLPNIFTDVSLPVLSEAIKGGIRYAFFFPGLRKKDLEPVIGILPAISRYLKRPKPPFPKVVHKLKASFGEAVLMEDMMAVVLACAQEPLRLRVQDRRLYEKDAQKLEPAMMKVPYWLAEVLHLTRDTRLGLAVDTLKSLQMLEIKGLKSGIGMVPTPKGRKWMRKGGKGRLKDIIDVIKKHGNILTDASGYFRSQDISLCLLPVIFDIDIDEKSNFNLARAFNSVFSILKGEEFIALEDFFTYSAIELNPFLSNGENAGAVTFYSGYSWVAPNEEELEKFWISMLKTFIVTRLFLLGGIYVGWLKDGRVCFSMRNIGRYLLGQADDFEYGHAEKGAIIVQPNFEVVFLSPSPSTELEIGRFAEKTGSGERVGVLFKITRKSIIKAASAGLTYQYVIEKLKPVSQKDIPGNVDHEIREWFQQCRQVSMRTSLLIHCPDPETAARVLAVGGRNAGKLTDTVVELKDISGQKTLVRKLRASGIFIA